ncbi:MAG: alpha-amylase family glycosyl hydrolase [Syntrophobacteraceae bacterium]|nr:alpha-amylase family glycosyl hydrolase [Syntrophobacteraceae bacterium]
MQSWPKHPLVYEINTWVWLDELSRREQRALNLASIPDADWDQIAALGFDAVWFMGVWERSPEGARISMRNKGLLEDFHRALPDFTAADNVGSPYCVRRYVVDDHLGGPSGLATAREKLAERGLRLILDFVPNHVAPDHPWASSHPEYFIQGDDEDLRRDPASRIPSISSRETTRTCAGTPPHSSQPGERCWPAVGIRTFRPGPTCSSSTRSTRVCAARPSRRCGRSPISATACAATWPCS